ncbi:TPA: DnaB-like helicase C-terminal domain-containing protein [Pasteurella multocida]|uniref:DnaB-like helicase C-terminal domain-containing protein n=1 Tax=Pasteurella multocida TaxID=747 RepID=UPI003979B3C0
MATQIQTIPYNLQAEQSVLGAIMMDVNGERSAAVFAMLKPESFHMPAHKKIYEEMLFLARNNQPIDLMTVDSRLRAIGVIEQIGGMAYLAEISKNTANVANMSTYAQIVRDEAIKRFTFAKLQDCQEMVLSSNGLNAQERLDAVSRLMSEIADYGRTGAIKGLRAAREVGNEWLDSYQERLENPCATRGLTTGLTALDDLLGAKGLVKQSLVVVGARPKCGKTAFYGMVAENCIVNEKKPALLFSLEMSGQLIFERLIGQNGNLNTTAFYEHDPDVIFHKYHTTQESLINRASNAVGELIKDDLLYIDDTPVVSMAHIRNECRRIKRERGDIGLIAVDYLTLMKAEDAERNDLAYGKITKELKNLAREMNCVVLVLTQLNRKLEDRGDKRPLPSDSRDTGQIEQECDYWIGLYKESAYSESADKSLTEVILRLNRHGGGSGTVYADQRFGSMFNCDQDEAKLRAEQCKPEPKKVKKGDF